mgnify:CR=1 FL=1
MSTTRHSEVLEIIVTDYEHRRSSTTAYSAWDYRMWSPDRETPYKRLWARNVRLHSGEYAEVIGRHSLSPDGFADFAIDFVKYRDHRLLVPGKVVTLLSPRKGNRPNTTYAEGIRMNVDGRSLDLRVPTIVNKAIGESESAAHIATISEVREPSDDPYRPYYLLYAKQD